MKAMRPVPRRLRETRDPILSPDRKQRTLLQLLLKLLTNLLQRLRIQPKHLIQLLHLLRQLILERSQRLCAKSATSQFPHPDAGPMPQAGHRKKRELTNLLGLIC